MDKKIKQHAIFEDSNADNAESQLHNCIMKELSSKMAVRRQYELAPVTAKNLMVAMRYYFPDFHRPFYDLVHTPSFNYVDNMHHKVMYDDRKHAEMFFGHISKHINNVLGNYPKANMDIIEDYIRNTMLHLPYAVQECKFEYYSISKITTEDYSTLDISCLLYIILATNINNWTNSSSTRNAGLFEWLRNKIHVQNTKLKKEWDERNPAYQMGWKEEDEFYNDEMRDMDETDPTWRIANDFG